MKRLFQKLTRRTVLWLSIPVLCLGLIAAAPTADTTYSLLQQLLDAVGGTPATVNSADRNMKALLGILQAIIDAGGVGGGSAPTGTLINTTATTAGQLVKYTDNLKTNTAPASAADILSAVGTQTANTVLAGPTSGGAVAPAFRALVAGDMQTALDSVYLPIANPAFTGTATGPAMTLSGELDVDSLAVTGLLPGHVYIDANTNLANATTTGTGAIVLASALDNIRIGSIGITIDGGGSAITTGIKGYIEIPYACTINRVTMLADTAGAAVVDIWKDTYANFPPTDADTITAAAVPTITASGVKSQDTTLTGWTTSVSAGDILAFNVDSAATITRLTLVLKVTK